MRQWITRASVLVALLAITACNHATPVYNVESAAYNTDALDGTQAEKAIKTAGTKLGWNMAKLEPGLIRGTLNLRKHVARRRLSAMMAAVIRSTMSIVKI